MNECLTRSGDGYAERAHYGLAVHCARRFTGRGVPLEELIGEAEAALLWAAARFDPSRGARFASYAVPFALGALRELCRRNAPMHVPRGELRILCAAESERDDLRARLGREPTVAELSERLNVSADRLSQMLCARERMRSVALDGQEEALALCGDKGFEERVLLKDALRRLGRPYAQVLWLRYFAGLSQADIAARFHVAQPQVSRWESAGKALLRESLAVT